jgi:hypothetical protein
MSEYGADADPDLELATEMARSQGMMPFKKSNVMQWTYPDGSFVQKYASKQGKSNLLLKFESPD